MACAALLATGLLGVTACGDDDDVNNNNLNNINDNNNNNNNVTPPVEICGDASDNDGDGDTDCRDLDCAAEPACTLNFTIVQTSDLHNHAAGYGNAQEYTPLDTTDNDPTTSGYARIAAIINNVRAAKAATETPVLVVDSGDFLSGTLFDLAADDPVTLKFFQIMGYNAMVIGNHDTDWKPDGLAMLLANAVAATPAFTVPVLQTNIVFDPEDTGDDNLAAFETAGLIQRKLVVDLPNGLKVGLLGRMGMQSVEYAKFPAPLTWDATDPAGAGYAAYWQDKVDDLRVGDGVDVVIMVAHGQFFEGMSTSSEDRTLATMVNGIDVIAAGHSHTLSTELTVVNHTAIFEPGSFGQHVSQFDGAYNLATRTMDASTLTMHAVDDTVTGDATVAGMIDQYIAALDAVLGPAAGVTYDASLAQLDADYDIAMIEDTLGENAFGDLCADAFRTVATIAVFPSTDPRPFDVAVTPAGVIRDGLYYGNTGIISFADAFAAMPTGASPFDPSMPGYPLVSVYLTAAELRDVAEVNLLTAAGMVPPSSQLYFSGMRYKTDPAGAMFSTVYEVNLCHNALRASYGGDADFYSLNCSTELDILDNTTLYRMVVDLATLITLKSVTAATMGMLSIVPKDSLGNAIDLNSMAAIGATRIDADPATGGIQELKEWMTLPKFFTDWTNIGAFVPGGAYMLPQIPIAIYGPTGTALGRHVSEAPPAP